MRRSRYIYWWGDIARRSDWEIRTHATRLLIFVSSVHRTHVDEFRGDQFKTKWIQNEILSNKKSFFNGNSTFWTLFVSINEIMTMVFHQRFRHILSSRFYFVCPAERRNLHFYFSKAICRHFFCYSGDCSLLWAWYLNKRNLHKKSKYLNWYWYGVFIDFSSRHLNIFEHILKCKCSRRMPSEERKMNFGDFINHVGAQIYAEDKPTSAKNWRLMWKNPLPSNEMSKLIICDSNSSLEYCSFLLLPIVGYVSFSMHAISSIFCNDNRMQCKNNGYLNKLPDYCNDGKNPPKLLWKLHSSTIRSLNLRNKSEWHEKKTVSL